MPGPGASRAPSARGLPFAWPQCVGMLPSMRGLAPRQGPRQPPGAEATATRSDILHSPARIGSPMRLREGLPRAPRCPSVRAGMSAQFKNWAGCGGVTREHSAQRAPRSELAGPAGHPWRDGLPGCLMRPGQKGELCKTRRLLRTPPWHVQRTGSQKLGLSPYESLVIRAVILSKCTGSWRPSRLTTYIVKGLCRRSRGSPGFCSGALLRYSAWDAECEPRACCRAVRRDATERDNSSEAVEPTFRRK